MKNLTTSDNTKLFHEISSTNHKRKLIRKVRVNGEVVKGVAKIRARVRVLKNISNYFTQEKLPQIELPFGVFKRIKPDISLFLESIRDYDEVKKVVWNCEPSKALSYDYFDFKFIKEMWHEHGDGIVKFM